MKILIAILLCFLLFSSCQFTGTGAIIKITDHKDDEVWDPGVLNRVKLEKAIRIYLSTADPEDLIYASPKEIRRNLTKYTIEYTGIVSNGKKFIYCQMILGFEEMYPEYKGITEASEFSMIFDGGCEIVDVWYDPEEDKVTTIACNGYA